VKRPGETGGILEDVAPFILEHFGINAVSPSSTARKVLLAFTRVGINAYLKEKLGLGQRQQVEQLGGGDLFALTGRTQEPFSALRHSRLVGVLSRTVQRWSALQGAY
jgi:hypothetical protein